MMLHVNTKKRLIYASGLSLTLVLMLGSLVWGAEKRVTDTVQQQSLNPKRIAIELPLAYDALEYFGVFEAGKLIRQLGKLPIGTQLTMTFDIMVDGRQDRTNSKEQNTFIYSKSKISVKELNDWPDPEDDMSQASSPAEPIWTWRSCHKAPLSILSCLCMETKAISSYQHR